MYKVKELMKKEIISIKISASLKEILQIFYKKGIHTLPVIDKGKLVGIIEWESILYILKPHPKHIEKFVSTLTFLPKEFREIFNVDFDLEISPKVMVLLIAQDLMNRNVITVYEDNDISYTYKKMKENNIKSIFVIDKNGILVGMISFFDIILGILKKKGLFE